MGVFLWVMSANVTSSKKGTALRGGEKYAKIT